MPLPIKSLPTGSIEVAGETVPIRSLNREEVLKIAAIGADLDAREVFVLMCGTGCTEEEAIAFRQGNDAMTAGLLVDGICILSGLAEADEGDDAPKGRSRKGSSGR